MLISNLLIRVEMFHCSDMWTSTSTYDSSITSWEAATRCIPCVPCPTAQISQLQLLCFSLVPEYLDRSNWSSAHLPSGVLRGCHLFFHRKTPVCMSGSFMQLEGYLVCQPHLLQLQPPRVHTHFAPWKNGNIQVVKSFRVSVFLWSLFFLYLCVSTEPDISV